MMVMCEKYKKKSDESKVEFKNINGMTYSICPHCGAEYLILHPKSKGNKNKMDKEDMSE